MTDLTTPTNGTRQAGVLQASLLLAGSCMPVLGSVLITPVLPQLSAHFASTPGAAVLVPMIVAIPALMIAIFAPFAGRIVDRLGRKRILVIALIAYAIAGVAPAMLDGLVGILVTRALVGVFEAAIMTACTTLIVDYFEDEHRRNRYLGLQTVATTVAATVFIFLGGALGANGWQTPFWVYAAGILLAIPMAFVLWEPRRAEAPGDAVAAPRMDLSMSRGALVGRLLVTAFGGMSFYVLVIQAPYLVVATGVPADDSGKIGMVAGIASLATAIGGFTFARVRGIRAGRLLPIAFGLQAVGMALVWLLPTFAGVVIGSVVASFGSGLLLPSLLTWVLATIGVAGRGLVTGWWTSAFFFGQFLSPILVGVLSGVVGGLATAVGIVGVTAAVFAIGLELRFRGTRASKEAGVTTAA